MVSVSSEIGKQGQLLRVRGEVAELGVLGELISFEIVRSESK